MIEAAISAKKVATGDITSFIYQGEENLGTYNALVTALGLTGGGTSTSFVKFFANEISATVYVPKKAILTNIAFNTLLTAGLLAGKTVDFNGNTYLVRLIKGANQGSDGTLSGVSDGSVYPNNDIFSYCEWNRIFNPIIALAGTSPEGMVYGEQHNYAPSDLGFASSTPGNSTICGNYNSTMALLRGSSDQRAVFLRSRTTTSTYWSLRPLLIKQ